MKPVIATDVPPDDEIRMGSEYSSARDYLARAPRVSSHKPALRKPKEPQHGSNDSDFGFPDQRAE